MSKSIGNVVSVADALARWSPDAIRLYVLNSRYRAATNLTDEAMAAATSGVERLVRAVTREARADAGGARLELPEGTRESDFIEAMEDDLDTSHALAVLFRLATAINRGVDAEANGDDVRAMQATLGELAGVLGLSLEDAERTIDPAMLSRLQEYRSVLGIMAATGNTVDELVDNFVLRRTQARSERDFALADKIRIFLEEFNIVIEDTPQGARWSVKR